MAANFEFVKKLIELPVVETLLKSSAELYDAIKTSNDFLNWTLSVTESTVQKALAVVGDVAPPIPGDVTKKLDQVFVAGISFLEEKVPIVKKPPEQIYQEASDYVSSKHQKLEDYKDAIVSRAINSVYETTNKIVSLGNTATQPLRDAIHTSEKFVDEKLKPKAKKFVDEKLKPKAEVLAAVVATASDQMLGPVAEIYGDITCSIITGTYMKKEDATSPTTPIVTETPSTSATQTSSVVKAT